VAGLPVGVESDRDAGAIIELRPPPTQICCAALMDDASASAKTAPNAIRVLSPWTATRMG
jgi:hypothetical protein